MDRRDFMLGAGALTAGSLVLPGVVQAAPEPVRTPIWYFPLHLTLRRPLATFERPRCVALQVDPEDGEVTPELIEFLRGREYHRVLHFNQKYEPHPKDVVEQHAETFLLHLNPRSLSSATFPASNVYVRQTPYFLHISAEGESLASWNRNRERFHG